MNRLSRTCKSGNKTALSSSAIGILLYDSSRKQAFFHFSHGQVVILPFLIAMT